MNVLLLLSNTKYPWLGALLARHLPRLHLSNLRWWLRLQRIFEFWPLLKALERLYATSKSLPYAINSQVIVEDHIKQGATLSLDAIVKEILKELPQISSQ